MTSDRKRAESAGEGAGTAASTVSGKTARADGRRRKPEWASGLKQIYDAVVDEPLPDSFADLLAQFDDEESR